MRAEVLSNRDLRAVRFARDDQTQKHHHRKSKRTYKTKHQPRSPPPNGAAVYHAQAGASHALTVSAPARGGGPCGVHQGLGTRTTKTAPLSLRTPTSPPWSMASFLTGARPRPADCPPMAPR